MMMSGKKLLEKPCFELAAKDVLRLGRNIMYILYNHCLSHSARSLYLPTYRNTHASLGNCHSSIYTALM